MAGQSKGGEVMDNIRNHKQQEGKSYEIYSDKWFEVY